MDTHKDYEKFIADIMSTDTSDIQSPAPSLVIAAREKVFLRKKTIHIEISVLDQVMAFFKLNFKFYHVGLSALLICGGMLYLNEPNYNSKNAAGFMDYKEALSITNTTISVNSSTMLTSIPTMVIRN
jgi:hypothetical protein